jgi:cobalt-zinc-cadmium efflux system outer membrane protein
MNPLQIARQSLVLTPILLVGCASLPSDWGRSAVAESTAAHGRPLPSGDTKTLIDQLLNAPLTVDNAITLALLNNPAVRAETAKLGFAAADVYDAARISNPVFTASRLSSSDPAAVSAQIGLGIALSFTDLLLLPARSHYADTKFEAAKLSVGNAALKLAAEVETAYYRLAGANQVAIMRAAAARSGEASANLAQRFFDAGNISKRELAVEKSSSAQLQLESETAAAESVVTKNQLNRLMGLYSTQDGWKLASGLPAPLPNEDELKDLVILAQTSRLDVEAARKNADAIASLHGLERKTRLLGPIDVGYDRQKETNGSVIQGPTLSLQIPLFNWGSGRVARAQAELQTAEADLAARELDASNDVSLAYAQVQAAKAKIEHYRTSLIPERETVVQQTQLEVNYMLVGIFDLVIAKQQEYDAYAGYLSAVRDYWIARSDLTRAVGRKLPSSDQPLSPPLDANELSKPKGGSGHDGHNMKGMQQSSPEMPGMDMPEMKGMEDMKDMKGMDMKNATPSEKSMPGMDMSKHKDMKMKEMDHSGPGMPGMDMPEAKSKDGMKAMEGMEHSGPPAVTQSQTEAACKDLKSADPRDPLIQALAAKCHEQDKGAKPDSDAAQPETTHEHHH